MATSRVATAGILAVCCLLLPYFTAARPVHSRPRHESSTAAAGAPARLLKQQDNPRGRSAFEKAPNCTSPPTANTSTADETSHLWGWNSERDESCAFKDSNGDVIWYPDYEPASWLHTPACNSPPFGNESVVDSNLKVWGWELDGSLCAYKDDQQQPFPIDMGFRTGVLSWAEAPACTQDPTPTPENSMPDKLDCLWGWQLQRNCAFRDTAVAQPIYYKGYKLTCNATASKLRAAEHNAQGKMLIPEDFISAASAEGSDPQEPPNPNPTGHTLMPRVGQKNPFPVDEETVQQPPKEGIDAPKGKETPSTATIIRASQKQADGMDQEVSPNFSQAPFSVGGNEGRGHRRYLATATQEVVDPKFPKGKPDGAAAKPASLGLPGVACSEVTPPGHFQSSTSGQANCLPSQDGSQWGAASEGDAPPVKRPDCIGCSEAGDLTLPGLQGAGERKARDKQQGQAGIIRVASGQDSEGILGVGHTHSKGYTYNQGFSETARRRLAASIVVAQATSLATSVATSTATSTATSSSTSKDRHQKTVAVATAVSTGGKATAVSHAVNGSSVQTTAVATGGREAVAVAKATKGDCIISVRVINKKVEWHCVDPPAASPSVQPSAVQTPSTVPPSVPVPAGQNSTILYIAAPTSPTPASPTLTSSAPPSPAPAQAGTEEATTDSLAPSWLAASKCPAVPDKTNSVQDALGRLWGYDADKQSPCAFRAQDGSSMEYMGYIKVKFDTAPACAGTPTATNSMADEQGRRWGWDQDKEVNCAFKDTSTGQPIYLPLPSPVPGDKNAAGLAPNSLPPTAAGPPASPAVGNTTNSSASAVTSTSTSESTNTTSIVVDSIAKETNTTTVELEGTIEQSNTTAIEMAAADQAQAITEALPSNATREEVALATAKTAVVYQVASEAVSKTTQQAADTTISVAEGPDEADQQGDVQLLHAMVGSLNAQRAGHHPNP